MSGAIASPISTYLTDSVSEAKYATAASLANPHQSPRSRYHHASEAAVRL